jgi:hypothetical protein
MPKPDGATAPSGNWAKDGAMSKADYVDHWRDRLDRLRQQALRRHLLVHEAVLAAGAGRLPVLR